MDRNIFSQQILKKERRAAFMRLSLKREERGRFIAVFLLNLLFLIAVYGVFFQNKFSVDTYVHIFETNMSRKYLEDGRPFSSAIAMVMFLLGFNGGLDQTPYTIILVISSAWCVTYLWKRFSALLNEPTFEQMFLVEIASLLTVVNVFFVPWFMYTESSIGLGVGLICTILAADAMAQADEYMWKFGIALALLFVAVGIYQIFMESFVIISCTLVATKNKMRFSKKAFWHLVSVLGVALISVAVMVVSSKLLCVYLNIEQSGRVATAGLNVISQNLKNLAATQEQLWIGGMQLLPKYTLAVMFVLTAVTLLILMALDRAGVMSMLMCAAIVAGSIATTFSPHLIVAVFWPAERTLFPLFAVLSSMIMMIAMIVRKRVFVSRPMLLLCGTFLAINIVCLQNIASDQQVVNALDRQYALEVGEIISAYERETGNQVERVAMCLDSAPTYAYYDYIDKVVFDTNITAKSALWSLPSMLNYYLGRTLERVDMPEHIYLEHFAQKNWYRFVADEQIVLDGDTLYIAVY